MEVRAGGRPAAPNHFVAPQPSRTASTTQPAAIQTLRRRRRGGRDIVMAGTRGGTASKLLEAKRMVSATPRLQTVGFELAIERGAPDAEHDRRQGAIVLGALERM